MICGDEETTEQRLGGAQASTEREREGGREEEKVADLVDVVEGEALARAGGEEQNVLLERQPRPIGHQRLRHRRSPGLLFGGPVRWECGTGR
jgi:hypothetical protein